MREGGREGWKGGGRERRKEQGKREKREGMAGGEMDYFEQKILPQLRQWCFLSEKVNSSPHLHLVT